MRKALQSLGLAISGDLPRPHEQFPAQMDDILPRHITTIWPIQKERTICVRVSVRGFSRARRKGFPLRRHGNLCEKGPYCLRNSTICG